MNLESMIDEATGATDHNMRRDRAYTGQPHTDKGVRGATEISGITFRDLRDCFIRAMCKSADPDTDEGLALHREAEKGEDACLCEKDLYGKALNDIDPLAVSQNLTCEVERLMGIYPNVPSLRDSD